MSFLDPAMQKKMELGEGYLQKTKMEQAVIFQTNFKDSDAEWVWSKKSSREE